VAQDGRHGAPRDVQTLGDGTHRTTIDRQTLDLGNEGRCEYLLRHLPIPPGCRPSTGHHTAWVRLPQSQPLQRPDDVAMTIPKPNDLMGDPCRSPATGRAAPKCRLERGGPGGPGTGKHRALRDRV